MFGHGHNAAEAIFMGSRVGRIGANEAVQDIGAFLDAGRDAVAQAAASCRRLLARRHGEPAGQLRRYGQEPLAQSLGKLAQMARELIDATRLKLDHNTTRLYLAMSADAEVGSSRGMKVTVSPASDLD